MNTTVKILLATLLALSVQYNSDIVSIMAAAFFRNVYPFVPEEFDTPVLFYDLRCRGLFCPLFITNDVTI